MQPNLSMRMRVRGIAPNLRLSISDQSINQLSKNDEYKDVYMATQKECNKAVAIAKVETYADVYNNVDAAEENEIINKLTKTRNSRTKYICDTIFINDKEEKNFKQI